MPWRPSGTRTGPAVASAVLLLGPLAACGSGPRSAVMVGEVTSVAPRLCVGRHAAGGECFDAPRKLLSHVRPGDCVRVTYRDGGSPGGRFTLTAIGNADAAAHASDCPVSRVRLTDGVGDVFLAGSHDTDEVARTVRNVDVVAADIRRTGEDLEVKVTYADLAERASRQWYVYFEVATSADHFTRTVTWSRGRYADSGAWHQGLDLTRETPEDSFGGPCRGTTATVDYPSTSVTITVPDDCLGSPAWARVDGLVTGSREPHGINDYADNPFNASGTPESTPRLVVPAG